MNLETNEILKKAFRFMIRIALMQKFSSLKALSQKFSSLKALMQKFRSLKPKHWRVSSGLTDGILLFRNFSVAISGSPHVCFILVLILISIFLR